MIPGWKYVLNQTSVEVLLSARQADRQRILNYFRKLVNDPGLEGDFRARDEVGRPVQIATVGKYMITYYADHAVREVRVLEIERI